MAILCNSTLVTTSANLGLVENGAAVIDGGKIPWMGPETRLPDVHKPDRQRLDMGRRLAPPGLVDCRPHVICAGDRAREFEMRVNGVGAATAIRDAFHPAEVSCRMGSTPLHTRIFGGQFDA